MCSTSISHPFPHSLTDSPTFPSRFHLIENTEPVSTFLNSFSRFRANVFSLLVSFIIFQLSLPGFLLCPGRPGRSAAVPQSAAPSRAGRSLSAKQKDCWKCNLPVNSQSDCWLVSWLNNFLELHFHVLIEALVQYHAPNYSPPLATFQAVPHHQGLPMLPTTILPCA